MNGKISDDRVCRRGELEVHPLPRRQLPDSRQVGTLQSNAAQSTVLMLEIQSLSGNDKDNVATYLTWEEQMEIEDNVDKVDSAAKCPKGEKLRLTKVEESTEGFLCEAFTLMDDVVLCDECMHLKYMSTRLELYKVIYRLCTLQVYGRWYSKKTVAFESKYIMAALNKSLCSQMTYMKTISMATLDR